MKHPGMVKGVCSFYWFHAFVHGVMAAISVLSLVQMSARRPDPHFFLGCALSALLMLSAALCALVGCRLWRWLPGALGLARIGSWVLLAVNAVALAVALYMVYEPQLFSYALAFHALALCATSLRKVKAAVKSGPLRKGAAVAQFTRRWQRWLFVVGCVLFVLAPGLLGLLLREALRHPGAVLATRAPLRELEAARSRWAARPFSRYRLTVLETLSKCRQDVEVRGKEVVAVLENACAGGAGWEPSPAVTVTDLFASIEATIVGRPCGPNGCRCDGVEHLHVAYDDQFGYPLRIRPYLDKDWTTRPTFSLVYACTALGVKYSETRITLTPIDGMPTGQEE